MTKAIFQFLIYMLAISSRSMCADDPSVSQEFRDWLGKTYREGVEYVHPQAGDSLEISDRLLGALSSDDPELRFLACSVLPTFFHDSDRVHFRFVTPLLSDSDQHVRVAAIETLSRMDHRGVSLAQQLHLIQDATHSMEQEALSSVVYRYGRHRLASHITQSLGASPDPNIVVNSLISSLDTCDSSVTISIAKPLLAGESRYRRTHISSDLSGQRDIRLDAVLCLAKTAIADPLARDVIAKLFSDRLLTLNEDSVRLRIWILVNLRLLNDKHPSQLLDEYSLHEDQQELFLSAIQETESPEVFFDILQRLSASTNPNIALNASCEMILTESVSSLAVANALTALPGEAGQAFVERLCRLPIRGDRADSLIRVVIESQLFRDAPRSVGRHLVRFVVRNRMEDSFVNICVESVQSGRVLRETVDQLSRESPSEIKAMIDAGLTRIRS